MGINCNKRFIQTSKLCISAWNFATLCFMNWWKDTQPSCHLGCSHLNRCFFYYEVCVVQVNTRSYSFGILKSIELFKWHAFIAHYAGLLYVCVLPLVDTNMQSLLPSVVMGKPYVHTGHNHAFRNIVSRLLVLCVTHVYWAYNSWWLKDGY